MTYKYRYTGAHPVMTSPAEVATWWEPGKTNEVDYVITHPEFKLVSASADDPPVSAASAPADEPPASVGNADSAEGGN